MADDGIVGTPEFEARMAALAARVEAAIQIGKIEREKRALFFLFTGRGADVRYHTLHANPFEEAA